jgi:hypothetical protein
MFCNSQAQTTMRAAKALSNAEGPTKLLISLQWTILYKSYYFKKFATLFAYDIGLFITTQVRINK